jgi:hypothetical protein
MYTKGQIVNVKDGSGVRRATVVNDGIDSQGKVRVRINGFPMDMSITTKTNTNCYIIN